MQLHSLADSQQEVYCCTPSTHPMCVSTVYLRSVCIYGHPSRPSLPFPGINVFIVDVPWSGDARKLNLVCLALLTFASLTNSLTHGDDLTLTWHRRVVRSLRESLITFSPCRFAAIDTFFESICVYICCAYQMYLRRLFAIL